MNQAGKKYIGEGLDRVDGRLKVTGRATYAGEFAPPNLAHAVIVQSTISKGKVQKIDSSEAEKSPGVLAVITPDNLPKLQGRPLLSDEIVFGGQHLAVVVAETFEQAQTAADRLKIEYAPETPKFDLEKNLATAFVPSGGRPPTSKRGDVDAGFGQANVTVDQIYRTPVEHHNPMEPHATVAMWTDDQHLTAYDSTQGVFGARSTLARLFSLPEGQVRIIDPFVGGGFGCKGQSWPHSSLAAVAAKVVKRPVKIELTRRQMFTSNGHRPETRQALKIAGDSGGKLVAINAEMVNSTSQLDSFVEQTGLDSALTYSCPNVSVRHQLLRLDEPAPTYMRAPGESSGSFSIESAMDEMAIALMMDPIELRLKNYAETDESKQKPWSSKSLRECYAQAAEAFGWARRTPEIGSMRSGRLLVGYGMATATYPANFWDTSAKARVTADGKVLIQCGTQDLGTGTYTILTQIAADALGVAFNRVKVEIADTDLPNAPGSGGSNSASSAGSAVHNAALALRQDMVTLATTQTGPLQHLDPGDLFVVDGMVKSKDGAKSVSYGEILKLAGKESMEQSATAQPSEERGKYSTQAFGAQFCEIHIDPDLKTMRVARWVGAFAVGAPLNLKTLTSQLYGGIIFGIGMALLESSMRDETYGRFVNTNLAEYHLPVHKDIPDLKVIVVPEKDTIVNPIGTKGAGEIGITGVAAAIANAVYHATGKRVRELPITLDKLL